MAAPAAALTTPLSPNANLAITQLRLGTPQMAVNLIGGITDPALLAQVTRPLSAALFPMRGDDLDGEVLAVQMRVYNQAMLTGHTEDARAAWVSIAQTLNGIDPELWSNVVQSSARNGNGHTLQRFASDATLAASLEAVLGAPPARAAHHRVGIATQYLQGRAEQLRALGVPNPMEVAGVEARMGFTLNLDPTAIAARAEQLGKLFTTITLPVPAGFRNLPENQQQGFILAARAMQLLNEPHRIQFNPYGEVFEQLVMQTPALAPLRPYYLRWAGAFNLLQADSSHQYHGFLPGMENTTRYVGGNYYPQGLTENEFNSHVSAGTPAALDMRVMFRFNVDGGLEAIPYSQYFARWLKPAADLLDEAAGLFESNAPDMAEYYRTVARAFRNNDFPSTDIAWLRLDNPTMDSDIGAVEQYGDRTRNILAEFAGSIHLRDAAVEATLQSLRDALPDFETALPVEAQYRKPPEQLRERRVAVVDTIYASGQLNAGEIIAVAWNQPNDMRIRRTEGFRIVCQRNVQSARVGSHVSNTLKDLALHPSQRALATRDAASLFTFFHEGAHANGVEFVIGQPETTYTQALGPISSSLEELKADVTGVHNAHTAMTMGLISQDTLDEIYVRCVFRAIEILRKGMTESHARGALVTLNFLQERGAIDINPETGETFIHLNRMPDAIAELTGILIRFKGDGNRAGAEDFYTRYGNTLPIGIQHIYDEMAHLPVDVMQRFAFEEEFLGGHTLPD